MENQNTLNYATLTLAIDDLKLLQDALKALELQRIGLGCNVKDEINRLHHAISLVIYNDVATANSQSASMNS